LLESIFGTSEQCGGKLASTLMAAIQGGGSVIGAAGGMIGTHLTTGLAKHLTTGLSPMLTGVLGGAVNAILPGLGALLGPLAEKAFSAVMSVFDRNKGRDSIESWVTSTFGSFDAFQAKMATMGAEGHRLWVMATQGVGRNNPEQARRAIDEVTKSIAAWEAKSGDAAKAAEAAARAQIDASTAVTDKLRADLDTLTKTRDSLQASVDAEAWEEEIGVVETLQRAELERVKASIKAKEMEIDAVTEAGAAAAEQVKQEATDIDAHLRELFARPLRIPIEFDYDDPRLPGFANGTNGFQNFGAGTPVMLHGWEKVTPLSGGSAGGPAQVIRVYSTLQVGRRQLGETVSEVLLGG
jgi:hypothetical protein